MRSVIFHLIGARREDVAAHLSAVATLSAPESWLWPDDANLYVEFYDDLLTESEPEELELLVASLGTMPSVSVGVDVSGRVPGDTEVREFAALILTAFRGVAWDDYTSHCWSLPEIQTCAKAHGHPFFDYQGWYDDEHTQPPA